MTGGWQTSGRRSGKSYVMDRFVESCAERGVPVVDATTLRASTYVPEDRQRWDARLREMGPDLRVRCSRDKKVVFESEERAQRSADRATARGTRMKAYLGPCGHWHTSRIKR